jgi:hypothetical protein
LIGEVTLPPLVVSRVYVDFRQVDSSDGYETKVRELAASRPETGTRIVPRRANTVPRDRGGPG